MSSFGENLKKLRKAKGLTQMSLAKLADVSQSTICEIEKNEYVPKMSITIKLANALNISIMNLDEELERNVKERGAALVSENVNPYAVANEFKPIRLMHYYHDTVFDTHLDTFVEENSNEIIYLPDVKEGDFAMQVCDDSLCCYYPKGAFLHCRELFPNHGKLVAVHMKNGKVSVRIYAIKNQRQFLMSICDEDPDDFELNESVRKIWVVVNSLRSELDIVRHTDIAYQTWQQRLEKL